MPNPKKTREEVQRERMLENYREQIREEELLARMNKATYEKMYYFIEATSLIPKYKELVDEQEKLRATRIAEADTQIEKLAAEAEAEREASEETPNTVELTEPESGSLEIDEATIQ